MPRSCQLPLLPVALFAAWASSVALVWANCQPRFASPAVCTTAHAEAPPPQSGATYCIVDSMNHCTASTNTLCVPRYGIGVAGTCTLKLDYAHPTSCTLDYGVTVIDLPRYNAACTDGSGTCQCEYTLDSMSNPTQVQVCECHEQAL